MSNPYLDFTIFNNNKSGDVLAQERSSTDNEANQAEQNNAEVPGRSSRARTEEQKVDRHEERGPSREKKEGRRKRRRGKSKNGIDHNFIKIISI